MVRAVLDTNVLISAIFWTGRPKQLLNKVHRGEVTFLTSPLLRDDLRAVLMRQDRPFKLSAEETERVVASVWDLAEVVQTQSQLSACRDEADNRVLECAVDG